MKSEQAKETIGARMAARQTEGRVKIKGMLWEEKPDLEAVASVAIASGIAPAEVDALADEIETAKAQLAAAIEADKALPGLRKQQTAAKSEAERTAAALAAADAADDAARGALAEIEQAIATAARARDTATALLRAGTLPPEMAPAFVREAVAAEDRARESEAREGRITTLKRSTIPWLENRIQALSTEIDAINEPGRPRENTLMAGKIVDYRASLETRLASEKTKLKEAIAELRKLEKAAA